jgi:hypothetical protein
LTDLAFSVNILNVKIKFKKNVTVDYEETRINEVFDKNFYRGDVLEGAGVEQLSRNFSNIHLVNGDLAISVPNDAFEVI